MIGKGEGRGVVGKDVSSIFSTFLGYWGLLGIFFGNENITTNKQNNRSSAEQAWNKTVAKKSWRYLFANPHRYISKTKNGNKKKNQSRLMGRCHSPSGELVTKLIPSSFKFNFQLCWCLYMSALKRVSMGWWLLRLTAKIFCFKKLNIN